MAAAPAAPMTTIGPSFLAARTRSAPQGFGRPIPRKEDARLVTGRGRFSDDVNLPGQAYAHFVRSPHAGARLLSIERAAALAVPGVLAVLTGRDAAADGLASIPHKPVPTNPNEFPLGGREGERVLPRITGVPMEPRAAVGAHDPAAGRYTLHAVAGGPLEEVPHCPVKCPASARGEVDHADIAAHLRWLHRSFSVAKISVDPSQAIEMIGYLYKEGLPIVEVPQTAGHVDETSQTLITAIQSRELVVYPDDQLRQQALNCVAVEMPSGMMRMSSWAGAPCSAMSMGAGLATSVRADSGRPTARSSTTPAASRR